MVYDPRPQRYDSLPYRRAGRSGLRLPAISLGLWHNFGGVDRHETARAMVRTAFDAGITHFDLANNYGPPPGSAELTFGRLLREDLAPFRDELVISSKAGYGMWPGPYGDWGSRKYLIASCDASLKRMGLDYVDVFYHHRPDPETPLEETMGALDHIVRSGRALYAAVSNYPAARLREAAAILRGLGTPAVLNQPSYSMFNRWLEPDGLLDALRDEGVGGIVFSPLAQGLLSNKYLSGIPADSRAASATGFLKADQVTPERTTQVQALGEIAAARGQTLAQLALAWVLRHPEITSALIGASRPEQITDAAAALNAGPLTDEELVQIEAILTPDAG
ncbi:aldo/keto reductase [Deinococcus rufus]|uniref:Aldo/keto reductase n=1 Tax=Deinococcus rufus TaxID=2136097 RepID=A0ABV7ZDY1_9DEIO